MDINIKRNIIINKAREIYIDSGRTKNITEALELYLANDAGIDEQIPLIITSPEIHQMRLALEKIRPMCEDCDEALHMQVNAVDPTGNKYPTAWICKTCGIEYYSDKTAAEWLKELQDEARKQNL